MVGFQLRKTLWFLVDPGRLWCRPGCGYQQQWRRLLISWLGSQYFGWSNEWKLRPKFEFREKEDWRRWEGHLWQNQQGHHPQKHNSVISQPEDNRFSPPMLKNGNFHQKQSGFVEYSTEQNILRDPKFCSRLQIHWSVPTHFYVAIRSTC